MRSRASPLLAFAACSSPGATGTPAATLRLRASAVERRRQRSCAERAASADTSKGTVKVAIELPHQGSEMAASDPIINGIKLAVKEAGGGAGGYAIEVPDRLRRRGQRRARPADGRQQHDQIATDESFVAIIGPLNSSVAAAQIPITNEARSCSAARPTPTRASRSPSSARWTSARPTRTRSTTSASSPLTTTRVPPPRSTSSRTSRRRTCLIIDDTETFGDGIADDFEAYFEAQWRDRRRARQGVPKTTTDYTSILTAAKAKNPDSIYFGGVTATGGARILKAAIQAGLDVPYVGPDGIYDGSGCDGELVPEPGRRRRQERRRHG